MWTSRVRTALVGATAAAVMVGGGALLVSPAIASSVTNWGKAWKKEIKPRADKRYVTKDDARDRFAAKSSLGHYYTKAQADSTFATAGDLQTLLSDYATLDDLQGLASESDLDDFYTKSESDSRYPAKSDLDGYYTKTQSDSRYPAKSDLDGYYTKSQSDARYAPAQSVQKGTFYVVGQNFTENTFALFSGDVSFGTTLSAAPTVHVIAAGETAPAACGGVSASATNPNALAGQLCVFLRPTQNVNPGSGFQIVDPTTTADPGASTFGFGIRVEGNGTLGHVAAYGSWAVGQ